MQEQVRLPEILVRFAKNTNSHFDYSKIPPLLPPKIEIWPLRVLTTLQYPPPAPTQQECVETNRCIPQGNRLVFQFVLSRSVSVNEPYYQSYE